MNRTEKIITILFVIFMIACIIALPIILCNVLNTKHHEQHVHFIDSNTCVTCRYASVYEEIANIYFDDMSVITCNSNNVILYDKHPCDYCNWGH